MIYTLLFIPRNKFHPIQSLDKDRFAYKFSVMEILRIVNENKFYNKGKMTSFSNVKGKEDSPFICVGTTFQNRR